MINIPPVGSTILVTLPKKFPNQRYTMLVVADDIENDSLGTIKLQVLTDEWHWSREVHSHEWYEKRRYPDSKFNLETTPKVRYFYNEDGSDKIVTEHHVDSVPCVDRFSIVEELWFDEELTGRKVEIIK